MIQLLPKAKELWESSSQTRLMLQQWEESASKIAHERLIADWVGQVERIADLGCGAGRLVSQLSFWRYHGYDTSEIMLAEAKRLHGGMGDVSFYKCDIFADAHCAFDVVVVHAVIQHQDKPIEAMQKIMELWPAGRYIFSLLVGSVHEDLYNSTVVTFSSVLDFLDDVELLNIYIEEHGEERFGWLILEVSTRLTG